jgi:hypothetical protein
MVLADGADGYWRLEEPGGTQIVEIADSTRAENHGLTKGTYNDTPPPWLNQPGAIKGSTSALFFASNSSTNTPVTQNNWIEIPDHDNQTPSNRRISIEFWFNVTPAAFSPGTYSSLVAKTTNGHLNGYGFYTAGGQIYFYMGDRTNKIGVPFHHSSRFHHIVGTYDGATMQLYYDGAWANSKAWNGSFATDAPLRFGWVPGTLSFTGQLDEIALYDDVLAEDKIRAHYQGAAESTPAPELGIKQFVLYADRSIRTGTNVGVYGASVGIASTFSSPTGAQLSVGPSNRLDPVRPVFAPSISLSSKDSVGDVYTDALTNAGGFAGESNPYPSGMPRVPVAPTPTPGSADLVVAKGETRTLSNGGNFRNITVNGTLTLGPGTYDCASLVVGANAKLFAAAASVELRAAGPIAFYGGNAVQSTSAPAAAFTISTIAADAAGVPVVSVGKAVNIRAVILAPQGTISISNSSRVTGALAAASITLADSIQIGYESGLPEQRAGDIACPVGGTRVCPGAAASDCYCDSAVRDSNDCTSDEQLAGGSWRHRALSAGTACGTTLCGGTQGTCDGRGYCQCATTQPDDGNSCSRESAGQSSGEFVRRALPAGALCAGSGECSGGAFACDERGTCACNAPDLCPEDPIKTQPGVCGCGRGDPDDDGTCPNSVQTWDDAALSLDAWKSHVGGEDHGDEQFFPSPLRIEIPRYIRVTTGNAGNGQLELRYRTTNGVTVTCGYRGRAPVAHPVDDMAIVQGRRYRFESCSDGTTYGTVVEITWASLQVLSGDAQDPAGKTGVRFVTGPHDPSGRVSACVDELPPPLQPEEVVAMRQNFLWSNQDRLNETDPDGHPAFHHGLIYIENKKQLAALNRLSVYWSAQPISARYRQSLVGKCGRVGHASDNKGVVVYAVFLAKLYNILRDWGVQAEVAGIDPPYRFIALSRPDEPAFVHPDGSLRYSALASSRFHEWLAQARLQQPGIFDDIGDFISDVAEDVGDFFSGVGDVVQTGLSYVGSAFDDAIDWAATAIDDTIEAAQEVLQELVLVFEDSVRLEFNVRALNRDPGVDDYYLTRTWSGRAPGSGAQPLLRPHGARLRIRQWGWGFLPVMDESKIDANGMAVLEGVKDADGRGGDLCIELDSDDVMITSDLVANEVCNFAEGLYKWDRDLTNQALHVKNQDLFALTLLQDSAQYAKQVMGHQPDKKMEVLTGLIANTLGNEGAKCMCLDFPSTGKAALTGVLASGGGVLAALGVFAAALIEKDLWWPDANGASATYDSRGVIVHEYGHFNMCSLMFAEGGAPALTGLLERVVEELTAGGMDENSDVSIMLESIADAFAAQVVGGTNYITPVGSFRPPAASNMSWCIQSPCLDQNYAGGGDYFFELRARGLEHKWTEYREQIARRASTIHDAFDSSSSRFGLEDVQNGDLWQVESPQTQRVERPSAGYLSLDDEPVQLRGTHWVNWIHNWLERGRRATPDNIMGGLVKTVRNAGFSWCDACELMAAHDPGVPDNVRLFNPHFTPRTMQVRMNRWRECQRQSELVDLVGAAPDPLLNLSSSCQACPVGSHPEMTGPFAGNCTACPPNHVPRGDHCDPCDLGMVAGPDNQCRACGGNEITRLNQCVACPVGTGPSADRTQCVACAMDAVVDWNAVPDECTESVTIPIRYGQTANDVCPNEFWVSVENISRLGIPQSSGLKTLITPHDATPTPETCPLSNSSLAVHQVDASGALVGELFSQSRGPGVFSPPPCAQFICTLCDTQFSHEIPAAQIQSGTTRVKLRATATLNGVGSGSLTVSSGVTLAACEGN